MYTPAATAMATAASAPPMSRRRRLDTRRRLAIGSAGSLGQEAPDTLRDSRHFLAQARFLELARPLRRSRADHHAATQAKGHEGGPARVAARGRDPARLGRQPARLLEHREVAEERVEVVEQAEAVLEHAQRRTGRAQNRAALAE